MKIPTFIKYALLNQGGKYRAVDLKKATQDQKYRNILVKTELYQHEEKVYLAVLRADDSLDLNKLETAVSTSLMKINDSTFKSLYVECDQTMTPPLKVTENVMVVLDKRVERLQKVILPIGLKNVLLLAGIDDFKELTRAEQVASIVKEKKEANNKIPLFSIRENITAQLKDVVNLPKLSNLSRQILAIKNNPYATIGELISVVKQDPILDHQMVKYASIHYLGKSCDVYTLEDAINDVLGYDLAVELAFGLSIIRMFKGTSKGVIGKEAFLKDAIYTAQLTHILCNEIHYSRRPSAEHGFLAGLLHNIGVMILSDLFPSYYMRLNRELEMNQNSSFLVVENRVTGTSHTEISKAVLKHWGMNDEIIEASFAHHAPSYRSDYSTYANIVFIANALLKRINIGDALSTVIPQSLLDEYDMNEERLNEILTSFISRDQFMNEVIVEVAA